MPDPWTAERVSDPEDDMHPWGLNGSAAGLPPVGIPPKAQHHSQLAPHSPKVPNGRTYSPASKKPVSLEVWASVMDLSKGRDKVLKTVQYTLRTYLYILGLIAGVRPLSKFFTANQKRMKLATAGLSLTRKCLLLLNPLRPMVALVSPEPTSARAFLGHLIDLVGALSDDVFCLSKLGLVSKRKGAVADRWANRVWFYSTVTGLCSLWAKQGTRRTESEKRADDLQRQKYLCDLVFVSYDIFNVSWMKEPVQCCVGLIAAIISTSQLYNKQYVALVKR
ncbi:hypothetical protein CspHIS471_0207810 [Cutaneotrichosporon sp. HIS471]|nr:hypothetical protein CspHIS471_0207810 [Cutaneotrichosporon sp. HIS471]